jgi:hypothetical protein
MHNPSNLHMIIVMTNSNLRFFFTLWNLKVSFLIPFEVGVFGIIWYDLLFFRFFFFSIFIEFADIFSVQSLQFKIQWTLGVELVHCIFSDLGNNRIDLFHLVMFSSNWNSIFDQSFANKVLSNFQKILEIVGILE